MKKLSIGLLVALSTTVMLSGCALYFDDDKGGGGGDTWTYCGSDGYYTCDGDDCDWVSSTCPDQGSGSGQSGGGFECRDSGDCAAGCYCENGICEEAGFCTQDSDCGNGYTCNESRSSCEPVGPTGCSADAQCASGSICVEGSCTATCQCGSDSSAVSQGYDYCDELRATCMSGADPYGTCAGEPTCNLTPPACQPGDVPLLGADGCWTGECQSTLDCAAAPSCGRINDQASCSARSDCRQIVNGINCTKPDGNGGTTSCQPGDMNCTCEQLIFAACTTL
ncbi:MAG TPA: Dickkopf N-terminal cysteine-rich domain-containing protein [Kofleriaceae bacterium]